AGAGKRGAAPDGATRPPSAPDFPGDLEHEAELALLVVLRDAVALGDAREAALRRQAKLLEREVPRRLVDTPLDPVLVLERAVLRRDESDSDLLAPPHDPERRESARALVVVPEEDAADVEPVEDDLGDRLGSAFADAAALRVAAAQLAANGDVARSIGD